ncbi:MAG: DUF1015 domain-containing protein [Pontiellaceae bacterium]
MLVKAFKAWRPIKELVKEVSSVPYDVVNYDQAKKYAEGNPNSFLHVVRADIDFTKDHNPYSDKIYKKAKSNLDRLINDRILFQEEKPSIYLYSQKMQDHIQFGIVACCHINDYENGIIKIHEKTRRAKEEDRIKYIESQNANTGPVFLAYRDSEDINNLVENTKNNKPLYNFNSSDNVEHTVWKFEDSNIIENYFAKIPAAYVADGHHRSASAVKVGSKKRNSNSNHTGEEGYNYFLSVLFPESELKILPYNRVIFSLPCSIDKFRSLLLQDFIIEENGLDKPKKSGQICMYLEGIWNTLTLRKSTMVVDPVSSLDVSILQDRILAPILNIKDPRVDNNIDFIGGIKGTRELEKLVDSGKATLAFSMYPTTMQHLFEVADAGLLMPPKSTWFEPKLRSGLLINIFD